MAFFFGENVLRSSVYVRMVMRIAHIYLLYALIKKRKNDSDPFTFHDISSHFDWQTACACVRVCLCADIPFQCIFSVVSTYIKK